VLRLLIDTSTWLDLAGRRTGQQWIVPLRVLKHQGALELLVPPVVIEEFDRNRVRSETAVTTSVLDRLRQLRRELREYAGEKHEQIASARSRPTAVQYSTRSHLGLGPETRRLDARTDLGPSEGNTRVLGEEVRPGERPQLGDGLVLVLNPAASAMPTADSRDLRGQDLVSRAHTCRPLQTRFDLDLGVPPGRILISRPRSRP
jgi:hypothetical protein